MPNERVAKSVADEYNDEEAELARMERRPVSTHFFVAVATTTVTRLSS